MLYKAALRAPRIYTGLGYGEFVHHYTATGSSSKRLIHIYARDNPNKTWDPSWCMWQ